MVGTKFDPQFPDHDENSGHEKLWSWSVTAFGVGAFVCVFSPNSRTCREFLCLQPKGGVAKICVQIEQISAVEGRRPRLCGTDALFPSMREFL